MEHTGYGTYWIWNILDMEYTGYGTYWIWNILDMEHTGYGTYWIWNILDMEHPGYGTYCIWNILDMEHTGYGTYWIWNIQAICVRLTTLPSSCAVVTKSWNLNFLEPSELFQACNRTALPLRLKQMQGYNSQDGARPALFPYELCCSVYCLCVNVYCTTATGCQPNCS